MNNYIFASNQATHQIPAIFNNIKCNNLWNKECFDKATFDYNNNLRTTVSTKILYLYHHFHNEENTAEAYGLIHNLALT